MVLILRQQTKLKCVQLCWTRTFLSIITSFTVDWFDFAKQNNFKDFDYGTYKTIDRDVNYLDNILFGKSVSTK